MADANPTDMGKKPGLEGKGAPPRPPTADPGQRSASGPPAGWVSVRPKGPPAALNGRSFSSTFKMAADEEQNAQDDAMKKKGFGAKEDPKSLGGEAWVGVVRNTLNDMYPGMLPDLAPKKKEEPKKAEPKKDEAKKPDPKKEDPMAAYMAAMNGE